jgi:hypothetical protein
MKRMQVLGIVGLVVVLIAAGCGRKRGEAKRSIMGEAIAEKMAEAASGGKAKGDMSGDKVTIKGEDGEFVMAGSSDGKLPDDFPKDVPVYEGAKIRQTISAGKGKSVTMSTKAAASAIADFYAKAMKDGGWKEEMTMRQETMTMLSYSKEDRQTSVMVNDSGDERMVTLTVATE